MHRNVVKLENVIMDPTRLYLIFELVDMDLGKFIKILKVNITLLHWLYGTLEINYFVLLHTLIPPLILVFNGCDKLSPLLKTIEVVFIQ